MSYPGAGGKILETTIMSLGGSMVAPDKVAVDFLKEFQTLCRSWLTQKEGRRMILIIGGGGPAREYQGAYRQLVDHPENDRQDWIGIAATRLNAELVKQIFAEECQLPVVTDPTEPDSFPGSILVAAGWKPGFSTDFDAVVLAERFGAKSVVNLSNIDQVYTDDPKTNPEAKALDKVSWEAFQKIVGEEWTPGKNVPFDPIATKKAKELGLEVTFASGGDLDNLRRLLEGQEFHGTRIHP
jgi:uridylate kinase